MSPQLQLGRRGTDLKKVMVEGMEGEGQTELI